MLVLVGAEAIAIGGSQIRGVIEIHQFRGKPGRSVEPRDEPPRAGAHAGLFLQLARGGDLGILDRAIGGDVEGPGRHLEQRLTDGDPELAHEEDAILIVDGEDRDGTRVADDLARCSGPSARSMVSTRKVR